MQKLSQKLGKLEIGVSLFSLALHGYFAAGIFYARVSDVAEPMTSRDVGGLGILTFILILFPSIVLLIGSVLHSRNRREGGWIIFLVALPMMPVYLYLGFFGLWGLKSLLSAQFIGVVLFVLIPISMFALAVAKATAISSPDNGRPND